MEDVFPFDSARGSRDDFSSRGYYGTVRYGITVRLHFGKKYDTELRTEFLEKVRYVAEIRYYIFRTPVMHALHFCFEVLHFSFLPITLPRQLRSSLTTHHQSPLTISSNYLVNKLNCYAIVIIRLFNHNRAYSKASSL